MFDTKNKTLAECKEYYVENLLKVKRKGVDKVLAYLEKSDFFTAPASTKYHGAEEGGLLRHSINVYERMREMVNNELSRNGKWEQISATPEYKELMQSVAFMALLHDICKANFYTVDTRNVKVDGKWEQVPYYAVRDDVLGYGHGDESVYILQSFVKMSREEAFAIRFHMGDLTDRNTSRAYGRYELALLLHQADMAASFIDEKVQPETPLSWFDRFVNGGDANA